MKVLITGGTRGIGEAIAHKFLSCGHDVMITGTGRTPNPFGEKVLFEKADFLKDSELGRLTKKAREWEPEILICNAGINNGDKIKGLDIKNVNDTYKVNVLSHLELISSCIEYMEENSFGRIVSISSVWGDVGRINRIAYSASKFAINGYVASIAAEVASKNILINSVSPGFVATAMAKSLLNPDTAKKVASGIPIGRFAEPEDIAGIVEFLGSEKNTYISGQQIVADGGFIKSRF